MNPKEWFLKEAHRGCAVEWTGQYPDFSLESSATADNFDLILEGESIWLGRWALSQNLFSGHLPNTVFVTVL